MRFEFKSVRRAELASKTNTRSLNLPDLTKMGELSSQN